MNILQLSVNDFGGCGYYLAEAITATTEHKSLLVCQSAGSYIRYPAHLMMEKPDDLAGAYEWADVVHVHDVAPKLPRGTKPKPTIVTYHGSMYRRNPKLYNDFCAEHNWVGTVATIDLTAHGLPWMPDTRPDLSRYANRPPDRFIVAHAPTSRKVKDTDTVIETLDSVDGIVLDVIEQVDNETCLRRKGRASVYVDQFRLCYGLNSIEAWAMGMPAIANAEETTIQRILEAVGFLPFVRCPLADLRDTVLKLRDDLKFYRDGVTRGKQCHEEFHAPAIVAQKALGYYEQALGLQAAPLQEAEVTEMRSVILPTLPAIPKRGRHDLSDIGAEGLVKIRWIGGSWGGESVQGAVTQARYQFTIDNPVRYMDARDAKILLEWDEGNKRKSVRHRGKRSFILEKE